MVTQRSIFENRSLLGDFNRVQEQLVQALVEVKTRDKKLDDEGHIYLGALIQYGKRLGAAIIPGSQDDFFELVHDSQMFLRDLLKLHGHLTSITDTCRGYLNFLGTVGSALIRQIDGGPLEDDLRKHSRIIPKSKPRKGA